MGLSSHIHQSTYTTTWALKERKGFVRKRSDPKTTPGLSLHHNYHPCVDSDKLKRAKCTKAISVQDSDDSRFQLKFWTTLLQNQKSIINSIFRLFKSHQTRNIFFYYALRTHIFFEHSAHIYTHMYTCMAHLCQIIVSE